MTDDSQSASSGRKGSGLRVGPPLVPVTPADQPPPAPGGKPGVRGTGQTGAGRGQPVSLWRSRVMAWLLFILLGAGMAAWRYGGWYEWPPLFTAYGPYVVVGLHAIIIALAFSDDWFAGILCLLVPGYSLYWLCARSGRAFFSALVFGLLAGIGEDTWWALLDWWQHLRSMIEALLAGPR